MPAVKGYAKHRGYDTLCPVIAVAKYSLFPEGVNLDAKTRWIAFLTIFAAVVLGTLGQAGALGDRAHFTSLHFFLFSLTTGGTLLLIRLSGRKGIGPRETVFFAAGIIFAVSAGLGFEPGGVASALVMAALVEQVRWKRFSWFPLDFFRPVKASLKFEQASLLCLSIGLVLSAATILNNGHLHLLSLHKLDLHVFYLGFSFPLSLVTYALIWRRAEGSKNAPGPFVSEYSFWALNLGVILFFVFIVAEVFFMQFLLALLLLTVVGTAMYVHLRSRPQDREGKLLWSALGFLALGSLSGTLYVSVLWGIEHLYSHYLLSFHSAANVFGWNMTWMLIAARPTEPDSRVSPWVLIPVHWLFMVMLPLARASALMALPATALCLVLLVLALFHPAPGRDK